MKLEEPREWLSMSVDARHEFLRGVVRFLGDGFRVDRKIERTAIVHNSSCLRLCLVPGGRFRIGFSRREEAAARRLSDPIPANLEEMRPLRTVKLSPYLIGEAPVTNRIAEHLLSRRMAGEAEHPAFLTLDEANRLSESLGMRLPLEAEWEVACRGGSRTLFAWGDRLPSELELAQKLSWDLGEPWNLPANPFGLVGLYFGEWCADQFRSSLADDALIENGSQVVRGGGAFFWPWQGEEWVWCMPAMRMPSSALPPERHAAFRVVLDLPVITSDPNGASAEHRSHLGF